MGCILSCSPYPNLPRNTFEVVSMTPRPPTSLVDPFMGGEPIESLAWDGGHRG